MMVRMLSKRNSGTLLVGMQNGTASLEDSLVDSYQMKHTLTILSRSWSPRYLPKRAEILFHTKHVHEYLWQLYS